MKTMATTKDILNHFNNNYQQYPLYIWIPSSIDDGTIYFYFLNEKDDIVICIEYWADEEQISNQIEIYLKSGSCLSEEETYPPLNQEQIEYFTNKCKTIFNTGA